MKNLKIFENAEFGKIRTVELDGQPFFVGKDVAEALGYSDSFGALKKHVDKEDRQNCQNSSFESPRGLTVINESGLYSLVLSSKLPSAKKFKRWITAEVLPAIRKTGGYIGGTENMSEADIMARALQIAQKTIERKAEQVRVLTADTERMRPKEIFADAVTASKKTILVGELAKILRQNGHNIGQNRLFGWMRENGYLVRRQGSDYNCPTQRAMEMGLFEIKETAITHASGRVTVSRTVKVTGKGQVHFVNKFARGGRTA